MQNFMKSKLPKVYKRNCQDAYLDPIREKLIYVTPEETVRQHVINYLLDELKVPENMIRVEEILKHYGVKSNDRADIIIDVYDDKEKFFYPIAVIECKAPEIFLDDNAFEQVANYSNKLGCIYCCLTNGDESFCYYFDKNKNNYIQIEKLPNYEEMLHGKYSIMPIENPQSRIKFHELEKFYREYFERYEQPDISSFTKKELALPLVNFIECLLDIEHKMPAKNYKIFQLIEDYGIRNLTIGNTGSGRYYGKYRSFLIKYNNNVNFISLSMSNYSGGQQTIICIAIDGENKSNPHHALQLNVNRNLEIIDDKIKFFHDGRITKGQGALKVDGLRKLVAEKYPEIIYGKKFYLGTLTHDRLWYLDDEEVMQVVENLISYALIRDDYRAMF